MSVEGVAGIFCVSGPQICLSNCGDSPIQPGLPYGSHCGKVASGVFGCKPNPASSMVPTTPAPAVASSPVTSCQGQGISVEGVPGVFCVPTGPVCVATNRNGKCPGPQAGLPNGAHCGKVGRLWLQAECRPGVWLARDTRRKSTTFSCDDTASTIGEAAACMATSTNSKSSSPSHYCKGGEFEMSVEGVFGVYCLTQGPICVAELSTGTCPGPQLGLPYGAYCGRVKTGVYGCKPHYSLPSSTTTPFTTPTSTATPTTPPTSAPSPSLPPPITSIAPFPSTEEPLPVATSTPPLDGWQCAASDYEMGVEGITGVFCLSSGPVCRADNGTGTCPGPQTGLPNGSYCNRVASGVFGCKPIVDQTFAPAEIPVEDQTDTESTTEPTDPVDPEPTDPAEPTEPEPTMPNQPIDTEPTEPNEPEATEPTEPTEPTKPTEPTDPTEPTQPAEPEPTEPTDPDPTVHQ